MLGYINVRSLGFFMENALDPFGDVAFCSKCGTAISVRICCTASKFIPNNLLCQKCGGSDSYSYCGRAARMNLENPKPKIKK